MSRLGIFPESRRAPLAACQHLDAFIRLDRDAAKGLCERGGEWVAWCRARRVALRHRDNAAVLMLESGLRALVGVS